MLTCFHLDIYAELSLFKLLVHNVNVDCGKVEKKIDVIWKLILP